MTANYAFAPAFRHTAGSPDITIVFPAGPGSTTVTAVVPTGDYYMWISPLTTCFLRQLKASVDAALGLAGRSETTTVQLSADGVVLFAVSGSVTSITLGSWFRRVGLNSAATAGNFFQGVRPVWYLGLIPAAVGPGWQPQRAGGTETTTGGKVYSVAASGTSFKRSLNVMFQPTDQESKVAADSDSTPMYPDFIYQGSIGSVSAAREWSILDLMDAARNAPINAALGNWQEVVADVEERYHTAVYMENLLSPTLARYQESWSRYTKWTWNLVWAGATSDRQ